MSTMDERIETGIEFLDGTFGKTWVHAIDVDWLNLGSGNSCVIGQLHPHRMAPYAYGIHELFPEHPDAAAATHGFVLAYRGTYEGLTRRWKRRIRELQTVRPHRRYGKRLRQTLGLDQ
jgi:hypothetical protein